MQVRTPDAGGKEGITRQEDGIVEQVTGALRREPRRTQCGHHQVRDGDTLAIPYGRKGKRHALLVGQKELGSAHLCKLARAREMIGVDVRVEDAGNLPPMAPCQVEIDVRIKGGIDHESFLTCANEVGEAAFAGAPHLDDTRRTIFERDLGSIPRKAPRLHPSLKGACRNAPRSKLLSGKLTGSASSTDCDHGCIIGHIHCVERVGIVFIEGTVGINMHAARNGPFRPLVSWTHIQNRDRSPLFQPRSQCLNINRFHASLSFYTSTGSASLRQSATPSSSRRARYPRARKSATASSAKTKEGPRQ